MNPCFASLLCLALAACTSPPGIAEPNPTPLVPAPTNAEASVATRPAEAEAPVAKTEPKAEPEPEPAKPAPATKAEELTPLTDAQLDALFGSVEDPVPEHRGGVAPSQENKHYLSGNEKHLNAFYSTLQERVGGGYMGVGTDQGYLFIGWGRFEIAWLIDYDPVIKHVHELYRLFFLDAKTPEEFMALWSEDGTERAYALIDAAHDGEAAKTLRYWYRNARGRIHLRFTHMRHRFKRAGVPSYLHDQQDYDYVRRMIELRRVRPLLVNLLQTEGLAGVAEASKAIGVPLRALYLSNAEQYWDRYSPEYRASMAALPWAEDALLLRTITSKAANEDYRYNVQPMADYVEWLQQPYVRRVHNILHAGPPAKAEGITFFETHDKPQDSPAARRFEAAQAKGATGATPPPDDEG